MTKSELTAYQRVFSWQRIWAVAYDVQRNKVACMYDNCSWSDFVELEEEDTVDMDGNPCVAYFFVPNNGGRVYLHNIELI